MINYQVSEVRSLTYFPSEVICEKSFSATPASGLLFFASRTKFAMICKSRSEGGTFVRNSARSVSAVSMMP